MDESKDKTGGLITDSCDKKDEKYALRPRSSIKRQITEQYQAEYIPKRPRRVKPRSTPVSKYRRKTANARERHRMKVINNAFESLRKALPGSLELCTSSSSMTKISTLRLAVNYIRSLSTMLEVGGDVDNDDDDEDDNKSPDDGRMIPEPQNSPTEHSTVYTLPQTVPSIINKTPLRCQRPSPVQQHHHQSLSYYFSTSQVQSSISVLKNDIVGSSPIRGSLSSTSDFEELLSDDSEFLEDNFDVFHDIPSIAPSDPFEVLLEAEKNGSTFTSNL